MKSSPENTNAALSQVNFNVNKPVVATASRQSVSGQKYGDPSSSLRADRYPLPSSLEERQSSKGRH